MPIQPKDGWRFLEQGEVISKDDMYDLYGEGTWNPVSTGCPSKIGVKWSSGLVKFSTRIKRTPKGNYISDDLN